MFKNPYPKGKVHVISVVVVKLNYFVENGNVKIMILKINYAKLIPQKEDQKHVIPIPLMKKINLKNLKTGVDFIGMINPTKLKAANLFIILIKEISIKFNYIKCF